MKFSTLASSLLLAGSALATVPASFDNTYDNAAGSMLTVACSTGATGLAGRFPTFGDVPTFPNIGGASAIAGFGSANCGTCWKLTFAGTGVSILVTAIDHAGDGFNLSQEALDTLTDGNAVADGVVQVDAVQVDASQCGL
ncbi:hypothetical protein EW145_g3023 [Phellinidium pouzarii]|uniref:Cerato-platanin n=1 Tax=Phellinidium pouzarii TaxID=167371 RepID=A0A4S4L8L0_9AGAM|nr:hypothetical protein EW145_g3023 [Phellinidium pouzarii]